MGHPSLLDRDRALLVVVDVQEGFRPAVHEFERTARNVGVLVQGAGELGLPVLATEQYPKGLGQTVPEVADHLAGVEPIEKLCFSAVRSEPFERALVKSGRDQALLCGVESHVCVSQTALDLLERGMAVQVARDAVSSRSEENHELGLHRMGFSG